MRVKFSFLENPQSGTRLRDTLKVPQIPTVSRVIREMYRATLCGGSTSDTFLSVMLLTSIVQSNSDNVNGTNRINPIPPSKDQLPVSSITEVTIAKISKQVMTTKRNQRIRFLVIGL